VWLLTGKAVAVKVLESVHEIVEEIEEEYLILRDHGQHPNLPTFFGVFIYKSPYSADQLWMTMEVSVVGHGSGRVGSQNYPSWVGRVGSSFKNI